MSKNKLKPCPFCKSPNIDFGRTSCTFGNDINIHCCDCGAKVQICEEYGEEELIKRWNTRAFDIDKVVAQLKALDNAEVDYYSSNDVIDREDAVDLVRAGGIDE